MFQFFWLIKMKILLKLIDVCWLKKQSISWTLDAMVSISCNPDARKRVCVNIGCHLFDLKFY